MEFHKTSKIWLLSLCLVISFSTAYADTITVGPGGPGSGYDYGTIQEGINAAVNGDTVIIAPGVYTGTGNKNLDFGGRAITVRSTDPADPCVVDATIIDCEDDGRGFYFHNGENNNSILSGLTIVDGKIEATLGGDEDVYGGGICCQGSSPRIENCCILSNVAYGYWDWFYEIARCGYGGGIACILDGHPEIVNCKIKYNVARGVDAFFYPTGTSHAYGGGVYCDSQSSVVIIDSEISHNVAQGGVCYAGVSFCTWPYHSYGGGVFAGNATITNCLIFDNKTWMGVGLDYEGPTYGESKGAGIYCGSNTIIFNCTIYGNDTDYTDSGVLGDGGGIYCSSPTVTNCIIWGNLANEQIYGSPAVIYSDVQDGFAGAGNINLDPCFVFRA